ncbi:hypothetical protein NIES4073_21510 [Kalymmatonema gypsitolerans NIES-4073]|nr:hypothetical protein NIES4073_21510 [Scytonema sp. NIES-4073]
MLLRGLKATLPSGMPMANATAIAVRAASPEEIRHGKAERRAGTRETLPRALSHRNVVSCFFVKHVDEGKTALPASTLGQAQGCAALSFLPTMKILRVDGSEKTFQHNPISMRCRARYANNCEGRYGITFVFWSFSSLCYHNITITSK